MGISQEPRNMKYAELGGFGSLLISDTNAHTGKFFKIHAIADSVLADATVGNASGLNDHTTTIPAGTDIYGYFTSITLTSGTVLAYKGEPN